MTADHGERCAGGQPTASLDEEIRRNANLPNPGDQSVRCLVCGQELQYITHTHLSSHRSDWPTNLDAYQREVSRVLGIDPDAVPVMARRLREELSDETTEGWRNGRYEHFRGLR